MGGIHLAVDALDGCISIEEGSVWVQGHNTLLLLLERSNG
jgi:hypothetical protein